jgi:hypothetical protein
VYGNLLSAGGEWEGYVDQWIDAECEIRARGRSFCCLWSCRWASAHSSGWQEDATGDCCWHGRPPRSRSLEGEAL